MDSKMRREFARVTSRAWNDLKSRFRPMGGTQIVWDGVGFSAHSVLTPINEGEVSVMTLTPDMWGDVAPGDPGAQRAVKEFLISPEGDEVWADILARIAGEDVE